jgi:hypothetical protein
MKYSVVRLENEIRVELETLLGFVHLETGAPSDAKVSFTATTGMQSAMGKVVSIDNASFAIVDTVWNEKRQMIRCKPVGGVRLGDMVWANEHLSLDGTMEVVASKKNTTFGDINFINLVSDDSRVRIDVLTGEVSR